MQWEQLKKNVGFMVQLVPVACRLDELGGELPEIDDDWMIQRVSNEGVSISNVRTHHETILGPDHIHHFTSNPDRSRGEVRYGFLTLLIQIFMQGTRLWVRPNSSPGKPVTPPIRMVAKRQVDAEYPFRSGIQTKLETTGYRVAWCLDTTLSRRVNLESWTVVVESDASGNLASFHLNDWPANQTLIKKRVA